MDKTFCTPCRQSNGKEESEIEKLKTQLLKMQIEAEKEKGKKKAKEQMPVQEVIAKTKVQNDQRWHQEEAPYDRYQDWPPQPIQTDFFGNRGGMQRGNRGGFYNSPNRGGCFVCGEQSHWKDDCPYRGQPPARGWAPFRGGARGRGRAAHFQHLPPANQQMPRQCPVWDPAEGMEHC